MMLKTLITESVFLIVFCLLSHTEAGTEIFCSSKQIISSCGSIVVLPCRLDPQQDATHTTVKWTQQDHVVHIYKDGEDVAGEQTERFEGRTSLSSEGLRKGNLSLELSSLKLSDSGRYKCSFQDGSEEKSCYVALIVEESEVIGSPDPIPAESGQDVILPCHLEPAFDVSTLTVAWRHNNTLVHEYGGSRDDPDAPNQKFKGRTSLFRDEMIHGNISLKLRKVTKDDEGIYTCSVPNLNCQVNKGNINLIVVSNDEETNKKAAHQPTSSPEPADKTWSRIGLYIGPGVAAVLLVGLVVFAAVGLSMWNRLRRYRHEALPQKHRIILTECSMTRDGHDDIRREKTTQRQLI